MRQVIAEGIAERQLLKQTARDHVRMTPFRVVAAQAGVWRRVDDGRDSHEQAYRAARRTRTARSRPARPRHWSTQRGRSQRARNPGRRP
jgi:hypothetical protein